MISDSDLLFLATEHICIFINCRLSQDNKGYFQKSVKWMAEILILEQVLQ